MKEFIMKSTKEELEILQENTIGPNEPNVATTDENLSVLEMFQQAGLPSLGRQIFPVIPMHGPTAALFNLRRKPGTNDFELLRNEVEVFPSEMIHTGLTQEVIQDIRAQYGRQSDLIIGRLLRGLANEQEDTKVIAFLDAESSAEPNLVLSEPTNSEMNLFEIGQRVNELILKANNTDRRTYKAFCVLPYKSGAAVAALGKWVGAEEGDARGNFITEINQVRYYLNPDVTATTAYVGLRDVTNPSRSSAVFSPYVSDIVQAIDPDTGDHTYTIYNRFAVTASPLHVTGNEMLFKFTIA